MSPDLERLIGRAVTDKEFRDKLLANPAGAVSAAGFKLSDDEMAKLKKGVAQLKTDFTAAQIDQQLTLRGSWK
jgi:hypothetical protein